MHITCAHAYVHSLSVIARMCAHVHGVSLVCSSLHMLVRMRICPPCVSAIPHLKVFIMVAFFTILGLDDKYKLTMDALRNGTNWRSTVKHCSRFTKIKQCHRIHSDARGRTKLIIQAILFISAHFCFQGCRVKCFYLSSKCIMRSVLPKKIGSRVYCVLEDEFSIW